MKRRRRPSPVDTIQPTEIPQTLEVTTWMAAPEAPHLLRIEVWEQGKDPIYVFLDAERAAAWGRRLVARAEQAAAWNRPADVV